jgi:hypothetical protein
VSHDATHAPPPAAGSMRDGGKNRWSDNTNSTTSTLQPVGQTGNRRASPAISRVYG